MNGKEISSKTKSLLLKAGIVCNVIIIYSVFRFRWKMQYIFGIEYKLTSFHDKIYNNNSLLEWFFTGSKLSEVIRIYFRMFRYVVIRMY